MTPVAAAAIAKPGKDSMQSISGMAFRIAVPFDQVDTLLERMEENDERIEAILKEPAESGLFSQFDEQTDQLQRQLFGLMASNYLIFRALQGRSLPGLGTRTGERKTQANVFQTWLDSAELDALIDADDAEAEAEHDHDADEEEEA